MIFNDVIDKHISRSVTEDFVISMNNFLSSKCALKYFSANSEPTLLLSEI